MTPSSFVALTSVQQTVRDLDRAIFEQGRASLVYQAASAHLDSLNQRVALLRNRLELLTAHPRNKGSTP
jgi:hypothetical protein